jgi:hypothetical protein
MPSSPTYIIVDATKTDQVDFNDVHETGIQTVRWNPTKTKFILKLKQINKIPKWHEGQPIYTYKQILHKVNNNTW